MNHSYDRLKKESEAETIAAIEEALMDFDKGNVVSHEVAMQQLRQTILENTPELGKKYA